MLSFLANALRRWAKHALARLSVFVTRSCEGAGHGRFLACLAPENPQQHRLRMSPNEAGWCKCLMFKRPAVILESVNGVVMRLTHGGSCKVDARILEVWHRRIDLFAVRAIHCSHFRNFNDTSSVLHTHTCY